MIKVFHRQKAGRGHGGAGGKIIGVLLHFTDSDCSHEIKTHLLLGGTAMANLDSILKSRDVTLPTKVYIPVITYRCESWALEKADTEELMLLDYGAGEDS